MMNVLSFHLMVKINDAFSLRLKPRGASNAGKAVFKVLVNKNFSVLF